MNTLKFIKRHTYIDNCLRSDKRPPSPLLKWSQILNFLTPGITIMFKWPEKNYNITCKLSLDFRTIKTMLRVLGDFSKTGQLWNRFDDSNTKSSHQGNILTISGHLDVIQLISDKKMVEKWQTWAKASEKLKKLKVALWNTWFDFFN